jgi:4-oxalocrotonate tautomerase
MPHVSIKHFPAELSEEQQRELVDSVTGAVRRAFGCDEGVISVAIEAVPEQDWDERVYQPEIIGRRDLLRKVPSY